MPFFEDSPSHAIVHIDEASISDSDLSPERLP